MVMATPKLKLPLQYAYYIYRRRNVHKMLTTHSRKFITKHELDYSVDERFIYCH